MTTIQNSTVFGKTHQLNAPQSGVPTWNKWGQYNTYRQIYSEPPHIGFLAAADTPNSLISPHPPIFKNAVIYFFIIFGAII